MPQSPNPFYPGSEGIAQQDYFGTPTPTPESSAFADQQAIPLAPEGGGGPGGLTIFQPIQYNDGRLMLHFRGEAGQAMTMEFDKAMELLEKQGYTAEQMKAAGGDKLGSLTKGEDGKWNMEWTSGGQVYNRSGGTTSPGPLGGSGSRPASGGAGGAGGAGGPAGAPAAGSVSNPFNAGQDVNDPGNIPPIGGAGGDPAAGPLTPGNITDPGRRSAGGGGFYAGVSSMFDFLPENFNQLGPEERMSALIGAVTRRQEQGLESQLQGFNQAQSDREWRAQGTRALEDRILGAPDVMGEAEIQRISGKTGQVAAQKANVLAQALGERRAAAGSARSGSAQTEQSAILQGAANQAIQAESDIRAGAAQQNFQSRLDALQGAGASARADVGLGANIAQARSDTIGQAQVVGDAFLTQNLLNRESAQQPVFRTQPDGSGGSFRERIY